MRRTASRTLYAMQAVTSRCSKKSLCCSCIQRREHVTELGLKYFTRCVEVRPELTVGSCKQLLRTHDAHHRLRPPQGRDHRQRCRPPEGQAAVAPGDTAQAEASDKSCDGQHPGGGVRAARRSMAVRVSAALRQA